MSKPAANGSAEKPLLGAVLCCTAIPLELRSKYAEYAQQMGAEHKLDLTSDVTHLLIGNTDTPKYKYVAKEREDVKVLRPEWIDAVRNCWMEDKHIDLNALDAEYRVPTLAGLKICITGFDELTFRAQLSKNVVENGGEYTGDLTKDVTHLIAAKPEGKKYEYGMLWQKKVVSLRWYKDTLERGMQLDETLYHPTIPAEEQGRGAWNRKMMVERSAKRPKEDTIAIEPPRKLRRTASAKISSQNDNLWTDIVGGAGFERSTEDLRPLRSSRSEPCLEPASNAEVESQQKMHGSTEVKDEGTAQEISGIFSKRRFIVHGFDRKKDLLLRKVLIENGAGLVDSALQIELQQDGDDPLLVVPHNMVLSQIPKTQGMGGSLQCVTELWIERCLVKKAYILPEEYILGRLVNKSASNGFSKLVINATGFHALETLHIAKTVRLMGACYEENFTQNTSVLVCNSLSINQDKVRHAQQWGIPIVAEDWLWSCIKNSRKASIESYLLQHIVKSQRLKQQMSKSQTFPKSPIPAESEKTFDTTTDVVSDKGPVVQSFGVSEMNTAANEPQRQQNPKVIVDNAHNISEQGPEARISPQKPPQTSVRHIFELQNPVEVQALQELPPNSPNQAHNNRNQKGKKSLFKTLDSAETSQEAGKSIPRQQDAGSGSSLHASIHSQHTQTLNGAIRDLLNMKKRQPSVQIDDLSKKKSAFGRTLSNISNSSSIVSNQRKSRASSIDSMNTDGIGSEIAPVFGNMASSESLVANKVNFNLTGKAKNKWSLSKPSSIELNDCGVFKDEYQEEEDAPQQTQLGYEDPEEAILLRERLAQARREKSQAGQKQQNSTLRRQKETRKIRDDDVLANAGWGSGRRTRNREKSPQLLEGF